MKFEKDTSGIKRYIAFDIHKEYALVGGQNARQEWVMQPRRIGIEKFREWAEANLREGDAVVICSGPTKLDSPVRVIKNKECSRCRNESITQGSSKLGSCWSC
jgi:hypothetical protein